METQAKFDYCYMETSISNARKNTVDHQLNAALEKIQEQIATLKANSHTMNAAEYEEKAKCLISNMGKL